MWHRQLGYLLHPEIQIAKDAELKIIDVACGTGCAVLISPRHTTPYSFCFKMTWPLTFLILGRIWLIDLAKELPRATLDGVDISIAHFPHRNWLPPRVTLRKLDILDEIPPELVGQYDVVHIGLIVAAIRREEDLSTMIDRLLSLLSKMIHFGGTVTRLRRNANLHDVRARRLPPMERS